jgi:4-amino-4-deoxy-L-arabinose transferase-like glycosyltransferase
MKPATYEQRSRKNWQFEISYILGLALSLRSIFPILGYSYTRDATIFYTPDTASYILPARELIAYGRFFSDGSPQAAVWNTPVQPAPDTVRTPGYPLLLTAGLLLRRPEIVTIVLQILLSCFTVYMVYGTAFLLFESKRTALVAAALYAIEPLSILFSSLLAPETLFTAILAVAVYYLVRYLRRQSMVDLLISGCALAASVYVRPAGYFLPLVIATVLAAWALGTAQQNKPRLTANLNAFLIVSVGLTGLWQVRNYVAIGYSGFSSVFSEDLYCCSAASVLAAQQHLPYTEMQDRLGCYNLGVYFQEHPEQKNWPVAQRFDYMNRAATRILLGSPLTYAWIYFEGVVRGAFDPGSTEFLRFFDLYPKDGGLLEIAVDKGIVKTLEALLLNPLLASSTVVLLALQFMYLSGALVAVSRRPIRDPGILAALFIMVYYLVIPGGPAVWGRFRHPAMPIICVLAADGLYAMYGRLRPQLNGFPRICATPRLVGSELAASVEHLKS